MQQDRAIYLPDVEETLNNLGNMLSDQRIWDAREYKEALTIGRELMGENFAIYLPGVALNLKQSRFLIRKQHQIKEACKAFDEARGSLRRVEAKFQHRHL